MVKLIVTNRIGETVEVEAETGISAMENIRDLPDSVDAICGGMCACATCHVYIEPEAQERLHPRSYEELVMLEGSEYFDAARSRLSCQLRVTEDFEGLPMTVAPEE